MSSRQFLSFKEICNIKEQELKGYNAIEYFIKRVIDFTIAIPLLILTIFYTYGLNFKR